MPCVAAGHASLPQVGSALTWEVRLVGSWIPLPPAFACHASPLELYQTTNIFCVSAKHQARPLGLSFTLFGVFCGNAILRVGILETMGFAFGSESES